MTTMRIKEMMRWMAAGVILMVCATSITFGQQRGPRSMDPKEMAKQTVARLTEQLKLDQSQQDSVYQYQLAQGEEMSKLFANGPGSDRTAMRAKMTELQEKTDNKMMSILSDDQKEAYKKIQADRQNQGGMSRGGGRQGGGSRGGGNR